MNRFILNPSVISELKRAAFMSDEMRERAKQIEAHAKANAPVDTGRYRDSLHTTAALEGGTVVGRVSSDVEYAAAIEFGTRDTPTFAVLRRAAETVGGTSSMRR